MLIREVIQRVSDLYSKGLPSDDIRISNRLIYNKLLTIRAKVLSQRANAKQPITLSNFSKMCITFTEPEDNGCCTLKNCKVKVSEQDLPNIVSSLYGDLILAVSNQYGDKIFSKIDRNMLNYLDSLEYGSNINKYFIEDGKLYAVGRDIPKKAVIMAVFEDPSKIISCNDSDNCKSILDREFKLASDLIDDVINLTAQELVVTEKNIKQDEKNNSREEV